MRVSDYKAIVDQFRRGVGVTGSARFDYTQNDGQFAIDADSHLGTETFCTRWTPKGSSSVYAYDAGKQVALARNARSFSEIDDPRALDFVSHSEGVEVGEIAVFANGTGFALIKVTDVQSQTRGDDVTSVAIEWELRLPDA